MHKYIYVDKYVFLITGIGEGSVTDPCCFRFASLRIYRIKVEYQIQFKNIFLNIRLFLLLTVRGLGQRLGTLFAKLQELEIAALLSWVRGETFLTNTFALKIPKINCDNIENILECWKLVSFKCSQWGWSISYDIYTTSRRLNSKLKFYLYNIFSTKDYKDYRNSILVIGKCPRI